MSRTPEHAREGAFTYDKHAQALADVFIKGLENGTAPWIQPWTDNAQVPGAPYNPTTGKSYRGGNSLALMMAEAEMQLSGKLTEPDNRWMTYKQSVSVGAQVRKGEKGVQLLKWLEVDDKAANDPAPAPADASDSHDKKRMVAVPFWVFHASQMDGLPPVPKPEPRPELEMLQQVDDLVKASGALVQYGGNRAFYSPSLDLIQMPVLNQFHDMPAAAATLLHELGHWTGHASRLNRPFSFDRKGEEYAREELRAEMSSLAMCQRLGVPHDPGQHVAYVASWISLLKKDPREILRAASDVEKILTHLNVPERQHEILPQVVREQEKESTLSSVQAMRANHQRMPKHGRARIQDPANVRARSRGVALEL